MKKKSKIPPTLHSLDVPMERRPDTSDTLVKTGNRLLGALELLPTSLLEQHGLVEDLLRLQIAHADGLLTAVDVLALDDGVLVRSWRDPDFDLRVCFGERGECVFEEGAAGLLEHVLFIPHEEYRGNSGNGKKNILHAPRATSPVAVMKVHSFAW